MALRWLSGRYFVSASRVSYIWLSASNTGKPRVREGTGDPPSSWLSEPARTACGGPLDRRTGTTRTRPLPGYHSSRSQTTGTAVNALGAVTQLSKYRLFPFDVNATASCG